MKKRVEPDIMNSEPRHQDPLKQGAENASAVICNPHLQNRRTQGGSVTAQVSRCCTGADAEARHALSPLGLSSSVSVTPSLAGIPSSLALAGMSSSPALAAALAGCATG